MSSKYAHIEQFRSHLITDQRHQQSTVCSQSWTLLSRRKGMSLSTRTTQWMDSYILLPYTTFQIFKCPCFDVIVVCLWETLSQTWNIVGEIWGQLIVSKFRMSNSLELTFVQFCMNGWIAKPQVCFLPVSLLAIKFYQADRPPMYLILIMKYGKE